MHTAHVRRRVHTDTSLCPAKRQLGPRQPGRTPVNSNTALPVQGVAPRRHHAPSMTPAAKAVDTPRSVRPLTRPGDKFPTSYHKHILGLFSHWKCSDVGPHHPWAAPHATNNSQHIPSSPHVPCAVRWQCRTHHTAAGGMSDGSRPPHTNESLPEAACKHKVQPCEEAHSDTSPPLAAAAHTGDPLQLRPWPAAPAGHAPPAILGSCGTGSHCCCCCC